MGEAPWPGQSIKLINKGLSKLGQGRSERGRQLPVASDMQKGTGADHNIFPRWAGVGVGNQRVATFHKPQQRCRSVLVRDRLAEGDQEPSPEAGPEPRTSGCSCCAGQGVHGEADF